jgi:hypothetical protein
MKDWIRLPFCIITIVTLASVLELRAQDAMNELTVDRPGIAESPFTVAPRHYQFEVGFDYFKRPTGELYSLPVALFRTGVTKRAELRISTRHIVDHTEIDRFEGVTPLSIGGKVHIIKQDQWVPETDIMATVVIPINPSSTQAKNLGYEVVLLFQNDFYQNTAINYNVGYVWDSNRGVSIFTGSFCFNYLPTRKLGLFVEYFGFMPKDRPSEHGLDGGMTYLVGNSLQLDLSVGISRTEANTNMFVSSGFSFRIN